VFAPEKNLSSNVLNDNRVFYPEKILSSTDLNDKKANLTVEHREVFFSGRLCPYLKILG